MHIATHNKMNQLNPKRMLKNNMAFRSKKDSIRQKKIDEKDKLTGN